MDTIRAADRVMSASWLFRRQIGNILGLPIAIDRIIRPLEEQALPKHAFDTWQTVVVWLGALYVVLILVVLMAFPVARRYLRRKLWSNMSESTPLELQRALRETDSSTAYANIERLLAPALLHNSADIARAIRKKYRDIKPNRL
jgi:hypothetical protein